jgi:hypothetical protein
MMEISRQSRMLCGILLLTIPTIQYGGTYLLRLLTTHDRTYIDNPLRQGMFRAGHAHAGVLVILSLVCQLLADAAYPAPGWALWAARLGTPIAAVLIPTGFFLSVASPQATAPNGWLSAIWLGVAALGLSVLSLGVLLIRSALR